MPVVYSFEGKSVHCCRVLLNMHIIGCIYIYIYIYVEKLELSALLNVNIGWELLVWHTTPSIFGKFVVHA